MINGKESKPIEIANETLYEMNQQLVEKYEKVLTDEELADKRELVKTFINDTANKYYMLLCNEKKDYTVFDINKKMDAAAASGILINECLLNRGLVKGIDKADAALEIWLSIDNKSYCYYFFPYDMGVISE